MNGGLATGELDYVGMTFVANYRVQHLSNLLESAELLALGAALGVADGATEVAVVADFDQRQAGVLLMVGAEAAVVGASPFDGCVVNQRHLRGLDENLAAAAVVIDVVGDENFLGAMVGAALQEENFVILENCFAF
jgi:hypothetical protein